MRNIPVCKITLAAPVLLALLIAQNSASAATRVWVGLGSDGLWTTVANWSGSTRPAVTDDVVFASSAVQKATVNNLVTSLHSVTFGGGGFSISGNSLVLSNGINTTNTAGVNVFAPRSYWARTKPSPIPMPVLKWSLSLWVWPGRDLVHG